MRRQGDRSPQRGRDKFYFPDTNVLITRFYAPEGVGEVQDFMPITGDRKEAERHRLIRRVVCVRGALPFLAEVRPRFGYARDKHVLRLSGTRQAIFEAPALTLALTADVPLRPDGEDVRAEFVLREGEDAVFALDRVGGEIEVRGCSTEQARELFESTVRFWRGWLSGSRYRGRWREMVHRSALMLKLLTYAPSGAIIATPTMGLPEQLGGERNWDYRYVWIRDAAFVAYALLRLGFSAEARAFMHFLSEHVDGTGSGPSGPLQVMYGIDGRRDLPERVLDHLEGYRGSSPVRVGNAAVDQLQLDIYGELLDSVYLVDKWAEPVSSDRWEEVSRIVDWVCASWDQPDEGIWETRGGRKSFTYSRLMCWVAIDRALRMAAARGLPADVARWRDSRDAIYRQIMSRGWSSRRRAFVQHYDDDVLDASVLTMPLVKFVSPTDPKWLSTLDALGHDLVSDSLVYRYDPVASPDGLRGDEGTFSMCSFWHVEALTRAGRLDQARVGVREDAHLRQPPRPVRRGNRPDR